MHEETAPKRQLTVRAVTTGLCVGSILCFSNTYFGLQTGWVTMGSLQSAILGFGVFRVLHCFDCMKGFTIEENVIVQTTSVATATMPLAAGMSTVNSSSTAKINAYRQLHMDCCNSCTQLPFIHCGRQVNIVYC